MGVVLGEEVGYKIGGDQRVSKNTKLVYVTECVILQQLMRDNRLSALLCLR